MDMRDSMWGIKPDPFFHSTSSCWKHRASGPDLMKQWSNERSRCGLLVVACVLKSEWHLLVASNCFDGDLECVHCLWLYLSNHLIRMYDTWTQTTQFMVAWLHSGSMLDLNRFN